MALIQRKTPEQREQERQVDEERKAAERVEKTREAFYKTPAGQARIAFERGDHVFQYAEALSVWLSVSASQHSVCPRK